MVKDIHRENAPSNKTQALTKSMNKDIRVVGTLNQLFVVADLPTLQGFKPRDFTKKILEIQ